MNNKWYLGLILGEIFTLSGAARPVEGQRVEDYSVDNIPGSPGFSSGKTKMEEDIKSHRNAVRDANNAHQQAITNHGPKSREARRAGGNLDEKHRQLTRDLYQQGKVPGSPSSTQAMPSEPQNKSIIPARIPVRQFEF